MKYKVGDKVSVRNLYGRPKGVEDVEIHSTQHGLGTKTFPNPSGTLGMTWFTERQIVKIIKSKTMKKEQKFVDLPKVSAMRKYSGWRVRKGPYDGTIQFGCGAVVVNADDLLILADALEKSTSAAKIKKFANNNYTNSGMTWNIQDIFINTELQNLVKLSSDKGVQALTRLVKSAGDYRNYKRIAEMEPIVLRRLAVVAGKKR